MLKILPRHKRIVHPLTWLTNSSGIGETISEYYPNGDVDQWYNRHYGSKKAVPEDFIWRFFVQMTQALAFIHGDIPPDHAEPGVMVHRDIKPKNVLVTYNDTKYPSFKLCDFQLAMVWTTDSSDKENYIGTFEWQPPENPKINTKAADIWSLGACVQFLATGQEPWRDGRRDRDRCWQEIQAHLGRYARAEHFFWARLPRRIIPIDYDRTQQLGLCATGQIYPQYSRELYDWMSACMAKERADRPTTAVLLQDMRNVARGRLSKKAWDDMEL
ncbi:kinase-like protein [Didymella exigua CBS 183.55]|uniref:Kinase-like protein n=1 Tax=Didymella exigua CBS 183.55 TaxID=1150837 RepID=A0A6A5R9D0_9PLEO|nr:kinase-like protein [Didymella exigua CBS 183.55]KAF1923614.1 kinase-like protein [Didymella exigua CBS 183.55]